MDPSVTKNVSIGPQFVEECACALGPSPEAQSAQLGAGGPPPPPCAVPLHPSPPAYLRLCTDWLCAL